MLPSCYNRLMKKTILTLILLVALGFVVTNNRPVTNKTPENIDIVNPEKIDKEKLSISLPSIEVPKFNLALPFIGNPMAEKAWNVFQSYIKNAKNHDLPGLR